MKESKCQFRIGELAKKLNIERFVIRFWEKEFGLKAHRSHGGQRYYVQQDLERFQHIKTLLYEKGLTIAGAKKALKHTPSSYLLESKIKTQETEKISFLKEKNYIIPCAMQAQLTQLREKLINLKKLL